MPEIEGVGEVATGAALARAVEPHAGEGDGHTHESSCLNCGARLAGDFCHVCGQKAHVHRTIAAWWHDFVHGVLHLDGKFWRTLPMLAVRPGELTRRYAHGERAKFISPLALFLFSVFLMFAVFSAAGSSVIGDATGVSAGIGEEIANVEKSAAQLERQRSEALAAGVPTDRIDSRLTDARQELAALRRLQETGIAGAADIAERGPVEADLRDAPAILRFFENAFEKAKENPSLLFYKMQANAYKFSWALIPISVLFVWLLFLHRRRYRGQFTGYDHFVFVTYSIAFMSLALVAFVLLQLIGIKSDLLDMAFLLVPPVHIFVQLRGAYGLSRWSAAWRTIAVLWFALIALMLFALILLSAGIFG